jgi:nicotinate-nucleotide adenylyltransferase
MTRPPPNPWGDRRKVRIGLLGGSFNPAHDGHRHVAVQALTRLRLDEVWMMTSPQNPLKPVDGMAPLAARLASVRRIVGRDPRLRPTAIETRLGTRFTADTLTALVRRFPCAAFVWLIGADNLVHIHRWDRWETIWRSVPVAILARGAYGGAVQATKAAQRFASARRPTYAAPALAACTPPAWVFLHIRRHPASSTALRARPLS